MKNQLPEPTETPLLSAEQMAKILNISGRCVLGWFYDKIIPAAVHQGKVIRFREPDVMAALEKARSVRESSITMDELAELKRLCGAYADSVLAAARAASELGMDAGA